MVLMNLEHTWLESTHFNHQQINQSQFIQQLAKSFQLWSAPLIALKSITYLSVIWFYLLSIVAHVQEILFFLRESVNQFVQ